MEGEDQSIIDLITDLASSRPDSVSEDERDELLETATGLLSGETENRRALADHKGESPTWWRVCTGSQNTVLVLFH